MRPIKFRAWDKQHKVMSHIILHPKGMYESKYIPFEETDYGDWMQYTGLKDKNGVEIYYNCDKFKFLFFYAGEWIELVGVFDFNDYELKAEIDIDQHPQGFTCLTYNPQVMKDFEIIGNIFTEEK